MLKKFCAIFFICIACVSSAHGQTPAESATVSQTPVTAIEVRGNKTVSTNTVISKMKTKVGAPYQEAVASDDLKRLYLLGFFSDIKIDTEAYQDGFKVIVNVVERPVIEKIVFSNLQRIRASEQKLKTELQSKEGQYLDYPLLTDDSDTIKKMYEKIGFSDARVSFNVDTNKDTQKATVTFVVDEGSRVRIKDIYVEGNTAFSDARILKVMKTRHAWLFNPGVLKEEVLIEDIDRIKAFYEKNGYSDVKVDYEVTAQAPWFYVTMRIQEGKKYIVGSIVVRGAQGIPEKEVLKQITVCLPDKVFSQQGLRQDIALMQGLYFDRGYIFVQIEEAVSENLSTGRVDIVYSITENTIAYVDKILIKGNVKTKDLVIRRELRIHPGDRFDGEKLRRSKERLANLGFFEEVDYDTEPAGEPNKRDLVVEVKEAKTGAFSFGGGYSTVEQLVGFVEIEQKNFDWKNFPDFTGAGQDLRVRASLGSLTNAYDISWTEPWLFDYPVAFGFDIYKREHDRDEDAGYGYNEDVLGGDIRLGREISEHLRLDGSYRYDIVNISDIDPSASADLKKEQGKNRISSLNGTVTFDTRSNVFDPVRGNLITGSLELAGGGLGGDKDFTKFYGRASHYFPLWRGSSLEVRGRMGWADAFSDSKELPIYERFFAGGAYTIRGYQERSIGPFDAVTKDPLGGNSMLVGNIEYTYPLIDFFKVAGFFDIGNVWAKASDMGTGGLVRAFGFGIRVKTPIGPVMLDYGIPLDKEPGEQDVGGGRFHFSMSHGF